MVIPIILSIVSLIGLADSAYILRHTLADKKLHCPFTGRCDKVIRSRYSRTFWIRNEWLGVIYYLLVFFGALFSFAFPSLLLLLTYLASIAVVLSFYLLYVQAAVIKHYCSWCVVAVSANIIIFFLLALNARS